MKKLLLSLLALLMIGSMAGCSSKEKADEPVNDDPENEVLPGEENGDDEVLGVEVIGDVDTDLQWAMEMALQDVDLPAYALMALDSDTYESYTFTPYVEGYEAVSADAMISSIAHSVVMVKLPDGTPQEEVEALAASMKENAQPNKWICVEAEKVETAVNNNLVLLVMSNADVVDQIVSNFGNIIYNVSK